MATKKIQILDYEIQQAKNADTVDGKHADEFASVSDVSDLQLKVGNTSVSDQINSAINAIDYPVDSVNGQIGVVNLTASDLSAISSSEKGAVNGVAPLGSDGKIPDSYINAQGGLVAQSTAPDNTSLGWIDTANGNILKFYDGSAWTAVNAVWG